MARRRHTRRLVSKFVRRMREIHAHIMQVVGQPDDEHDDALTIAQWQLAGAQALAVRIEQLGGRI